jgi:hypothetical protein
MAAAGICQSGIGPETRLSSEMIDLRGWTLPVRQFVTYAFCPRGPSIVSLHVAVSRGRGGAPSLSTKDGGHRHERW